MDTFDADYRAGRRWVTSSNDDIWSFESGYKTKSEAIEMADESDFNVGYTSRLMIEDFGSLHHAECFIERMVENAYEMIGEAADEFPTTTDTFVKEEIAPFFALMISKILAKNEHEYRIDQVDTFPPKYKSEDEIPGSVGGQIEEEEFEIRFQEWVKSVFTIDRISYKAPEQINDLRSNFRQLDQMGREIRKGRDSSGKCNLCNLAGGHHPLCPNLMPGDTALIPPGCPHSPDEEDDENLPEEEPSPTHRPFDPEAHIHHIHSRSRGELIQIAGDEGGDPNLRLMAKEEIGRRNALGISDLDCAENES